MPQRHEPHESSDASPIGKDEWVEQVEGRRRALGGPRAAIAAGWHALPAHFRYLLILLIAVLFPALISSEFVLDALQISDSAFILRTGVRFLTFAILAIGLNVVVGYAGLLDLGYIAFMGIAGYLYAYASSEYVQVGDWIPYGLALPSLASIPLIMIITALIGWLIGAASIRLTGDYLAIVTLGFGTVFLQLALTATRVRVPWSERPVDLTRGPNGINNLDDIALFGYRFESTMQYYFLFLGLLILVYVAVHHLNQSRIGRAWRALREDELAAEVMGMPTRRLKLLAFAIGAAIAALAGSVDAAFQGNVIPNPRYSVLTLITLYAMVVLGGAGSLPGALIGAFIFTVVPELLRDIALAGYLFYGALIVALIASLRPWSRLVSLAALTVGGGYALKFLVRWLRPTWDSGYPDAGGILNEVVQGWLIIPHNFKVAGNVAIWLAIFALLATVLLHQRHRLLHQLCLGLSVYLAIFSWETRLAVEPSATRILIIGITLVALMIFRPQGILGQTQVRII